MSIQRLHFLVNKLNIYRHEYYNLNSPSITDAEYDALFDELKQLEEETEIILSNSPTQTVGYEVKSKLQKVTHPIPLLSLEKTKDVEEIKKFLKNTPHMVMIKADGLTVKLDYDKGELVQASTRGDGTTGEDITHNARTFQNIPVKIPYLGKLSVVGEAIIHQEDFDLINEELQKEGRKTYTHPRSLVSGSVRQLSNQECANRNVHFYCFGLLECEDALSDSKDDRFLWLGNLGFSIVYGTKSDIYDIKILQYYIDTLENLAQENGLPIDGIVFSFDSVEYSNSLGNTSHHPLHSLAFKFEDVITTTKITDIEWSIGKTGTITPVAIFEEVDIDGSAVSRASLHNISIMEELELGYGDIIGVVKANMIIPQVITNYTRTNTFKIPNQCPCCSVTTEIKQDNNSKVLVCPNKNCSEKKLRKLMHFVSRDAMNIEGLSEATLEKFIQKGFIDTYLDIYKLSQYKNEIIEMDGFGEKSYNKLIESIEKSKITDFYRVIYSQSIHLIGRTASKTIARHFNYKMEDFLNAICYQFDFSNLDDFGSTMNDSIQSWCDDLVNLRLFGEFLDIVTINIPAVVNSELMLRDLKGLTFCCTGEVKKFKSRKELEELITSRNGKLSSSVSSKTFALITNDKESGSSKNKKAKELGIQIMNEDEFAIYMGI